MLLTCCYIPGNMLSDKSHKISQGTQSLLWEIYKCSRLYRSQLCSFPHKTILPPIHCHVTCGDSLQESFSLHWLWVWPFDLLCPIKCEHEWCVLYLRSFKGRCMFWLFLFSFYHEKDISQMWVTPGMKKIHGSEPQFSCSCCSQYTMRKKHWNVGFFVAVA